MRIDEWTNITWNNIWKRVTEGDQEGTKIKWEVEIEENDRISRQKQMAKNSVSLSGDDRDLHMNDSESL